MFIETVTSVYHWSDRTFSFRTTRNMSLQFTAGEFVMIGLKIDNKWCMRAYSVVSPPGSSELEFFSIKIADGMLTSRLQHLQVGDQIKVGDRAFGTLRTDALTPGGDLWLLATGTGLAPFMSMIQDAKTLAPWNRVHLVHSVHDRQDLAYYEQLTTGNKQFNYCPIVPSAGDARITTQLVSGQLAVNTSQDKIMLCGNMAFNKEVMSWCQQQGMAEGLVRRPGQYVVEQAFVDK